MKILHIGNPEAFKNFAICDFFLKRGHEVHYFSPKPIKKRYPGVVYHHNSDIGPGKIGILKNILFLRKVIKQLKPDIVHAHNVGTYGWMAGLAGFSPLIMHAYGSDVLPSQTAKLKPYQFWLSKNAVRKADRLVVTGKHMVSTVAANFNIKPEKIRAIPRGVDLTVFRRYNDEEIPALKLKYGIPPNKIVLLSPRYLFDSVYNIEIIINAVSRVARKNDEIVLIQMHNHSKDHKAYIDIERLIASLDMQDRIVLKKNVPNSQVAELLNISDICISVPSSDGFPVSVLEASACGVPMIVSRLPYTKEWFENGRNGMVIEPGSIAELSDAIGALLDNPEMRRAFVQSNLEKVEKEADYHACMRRLEALYIEVIECPS